MNQTIIVMGGSFNPPTLAHQRLLLGAVETVGADKGIFVPSPHAHVSRKMTRAKQPEEALTEPMRLQLLQAMCADDPRLEVEPCEFSRMDEGCSYDSMNFIQEKHPHAVLYYLVGGDKLSEIPRWYRIEEFLEKFCVLVVKRNGDEPETGLWQDPFLRANRARFQIISAPRGMEGVSSSAVREKMRTGEPGAEELLHPKVWELLQKHKGEHHVF